MSNQPRRPSLIAALRALDRPRFMIFVPTIMAGGILFSLLVLVRDVFNRLVGDRLTSHAGNIVGRQVSYVTRTGRIDGDVKGLVRRRVDFAVVSLAFLALAVYLLPGATFNYLRPDGYLSDIAWIWAISLLSVLVFAVGGLLIAYATIRYDRLPPALLPLLARTPLLRGQTMRPRDVVFIEGRRARHLIAFSRVWVLVVCGMLIALAFTRRIPRSPEAGIMGRAIEQPIQLVVLLIIALAALSGSRKPLAAAVAMALAATVLGVFASYEYPPRTALLVTAAFALPGVSFWLAGRRRLSAAGVAFLAVGTALTLTATAVGATNIHNHYFGATTPSSRTPALPVDRVLWAWAGAVTESSVRVNAELARTAAQVRLVISEDESLTSPQFASQTTPDRSRIVSLGSDGLDANTKYYYSFEVDGIVDRYFRGSFRTWPAGQSGFRLAFSSCSRTGSNSVVYDAIRQSQPLLYLNLGDFFYANIDTNDAARFRSAYRANLTAPAAAALYREVAVAYLWDDHDYGANDANRTSASRPAAMQSYRQLTPHYPLAGESAPIYQAFTIGRVRFVLTDTRSARSPQDQPDDGTKTMLGAQQLAWFEGELRSASQYAAVVWVNPDPWIGPQQAGSDHWAGYSTERTRIANLIAYLGVNNLVMLSGDVHGLAADNGSNAAFATDGRGGFPVLHAAALDRPGSMKGGPYSEGARAGSGQFAIVDVADLGDRVRIEYSGRDYRGTEWISYTFELPAGSRT